MLKYASKIFLNIFLSVLATVIGSYLADQYFEGRPAADAPVSLADATIGPKSPDANAASRVAVKADITALERPSAVANALGPARATGGRSVDKTNNEKAAAPIDKLAESTNVPARQHRSAPRYKQTSKTNTIAAPESASLTLGPPELGRATTGRFSNTNANSACCSAWGPDADRRAKLLMFRAAKGSILDAYSHPTDAFGVQQHDRTRAQTGPASALPKCG